MSIPGSICGFCQNEDSLIAEYPVVDIFKHQFTMAYCPDCQAHSLFPRPGPEMLKKAYSDDYYGRSEKKFSFPLVEDVLNWFRESRGRKVSRYLEDGDRILDLGCGNGFFLKSLIKKKNIIAWGIEPPGRSADRASMIQGISLKKGYLEKDDFEKHSLKAITLFHVFEHLTDPLGTLDIIGQILMPGGILILSFPNIDSWQSKMFKGYWLHLDPPRHLFFLPPRALIHLMQKRGFTLLRENYLSLEQNPFGMTQSILNLLTGKKEILFEYLKGNHEYLLGYPHYKVLLQQFFFFITFPLFAITNCITGICKKGATVELTFRKLN
jgi:SAM-dependent methyltransferase